MVYSTFMGHNKNHRFLRLHGFFCNSCQITQIQRASNRLMGFHPGWSFRLGKLSVNLQLGDSQIRQNYNKISVIRVICGKNKLYVQLILNRYLLYYFLSFL